MPEPILPSHFKPASIQSSRRASTCLRQRHLLLLGTLLVLTLTLLSPGTARARTEQTGEISGQILNGSRNNQPVANQSVTLQIAQGTSSRDLVTLTTDAQGRYAFSALESDSSVEYAIYTLYQNAQYVTDLIDLSKTANQKVNLMVYDSTPGTSNLAVVQAAILLDKVNTQAGTLTISETFAFENLGLTTYVGSLDSSHGKPNALIFSLPTNARFLTLDDNFNGYKSIQVDKGFASNAAVPPGISSFSFSFQVPYSGTASQFSYQTVYPTVSLSLLTPLNIQTTPQGLTAKGPSNTQSGTYQLFAAEKLGANKSVSVQLVGLPAPALVVQNTPEPVNPGLIWLVVLLIVLIALAGVGGYFYNTRRRKARSRKPTTAARKQTPSVSKQKAAASKEVLLEEMLELDQAYEAGKLKKAAYQEQRARLKARLRNLLSKEPEKETAGKGAGNSGREKK